MNFGCMTIEQATKRDLVVANGIILKIILTNTIIGFVGIINKKKTSFFKNSWFVGRYLSFLTSDKSHFSKCSNVFNICSSFLSLFHGNFLVCSDYFLFYSVSHICFIGN